MMTPEKTIEWLTDERDESRLIGGPRLEWAYALDMALRALSAAVEHHRLGYVLLDDVLAVFDTWRKALPLDRGFSHSEGLAFVRDVSLKAGITPVPRSIYCASCGQRKAACDGC